MSLIPPRETNSSPSSTTSSASSGDQLARLLDRGAVLAEAHPPGADGRGRRGPRRREAALGEQGVGATTGHEANRTKAGSSPSGSPLAAAHCDRAHTRIAHTFVPWFLAMTLFRAIPINVHAALEVLAAPLLIVAPFALGFDYLAGALSIAPRRPADRPRDLRLRRRQRGERAAECPRGTRLHAGRRDDRGRSDRGDRRRLHRNSLFGRVRLRAHGADRLNAVQSSARSLIPAYLPQTNSSTHISPPCSTPETALFGGPFLFQGTYPAP